MGSVANTCRDAGFPEKYFFESGGQPLVCESCSGILENLSTSPVLMDLRRFLNASKRNKWPARDKMRVQASKIKPERIL